MRIIATALLLFLTSCVHRATETKKVYFPQMPEPQLGVEDVWLTGGDSGYLVIDRGCVRLKSDTDHKIATIFWHHAFQLALNGNSIAIKSSRTGKLYEIGTHVSIGGGTMSTEAAQQIDPIAVGRCGPRFASGWIAE